MFCSNCGNKLADGSKFCPKCGNKLGEAGSTDSVSSEKDDIKLSAAAISFYKKGNDYLNQKDFDNAILAFGKALKQEPGYLDAYKYRAVAFGGIGKYGKAIKDLDKAIDIDPNNASLYYLRGLSYYSHNEEEDDDEDESAMGMMYGDFNDEDEDEENESVQDYIEQAIMDFSAAIEIDEKYIDAYLERAKIYEERKEYDSAIKDYSSLIDIDPDNCDYYNKRGWIYYLIDENDKALSDFSKTLEIDSHNTTALYYRGLTYQYLENYDQAIDDFTSALSLDSENTNFFAYRGKTFATMEKYEDAMNDLNKAIEINPENITALSCRGNIFCMRKQYSKGKKDYDEVLKLNPNYSIDNLPYYAETQTFAYSKAMKPLFSDDSNIIIYKMVYVISGEQEYRNKKEEQYLTMYDNCSLQFYEYGKDHDYFGFILQSDADKFINKTLAKEKLLGKNESIYEEKYLYLHGIDNLHSVCNLYCIKDITGDRYGNKPIFYFIFDANEKKVFLGVKDGEPKWGEIGDRGKNIDNEIKSFDVALKIYKRLIELKYDNIYLLAKFARSLHKVMEVNIFNRHYHKLQQGDDDEEGDDDENEEIDDDDEEDENDTDEDNDEEWDYDSKINFSTEKIKSNHNDFDAWLFRGGVYLDGQQYDEAISDFTECIRIKPNRVQGWVKRGDAFLKKKEYDKAISDYSEGVKLNPHFSLLSRGKTYFKIKAYNKAIIDFNEIIITDIGYGSKDDPEAYLYRGLSYLELGQINKGIMDLKKAKDSKLADDENDIDEEDENDTMEINNTIKEAEKQFQIDIDNYDDNNITENEDTQLLAFHQIYDQGMEYYEKKDYKSAIDSFEKIIGQCDPKIHIPEKIACLYKMYAISKIMLFLDNIDNFIDEENDTIIHKDIIFDHINILKKAFEHNPKESSFFYFISSVFEFLCSDKKDEKRKEYFISAIQNIDRAIKLDPNDENYKKHRKDLLDRNKDLENQEEQLLTPEQVQEPEKENIQEDNKTPIEVLEETAEQDIHQTTMDDVPENIQEAPQQTVQTYKDAVKEDGDGSSTENQNSGSSSSSNYSSSSSSKSGGSKIPNIIGAVICAVVGYFLFDLLGAIGGAVVGWFLFGKIIGKKKVKK